MGQEQQRRLCSSRVPVPRSCSVHLGVLCCVYCDHVAPPLLVAASTAAWIPPFPRDLHACPAQATLWALVNCSPKNRQPDPRVPSDG